MKVAVVVAAALLAVASVASAAMRSYEGEQVLRVRVLNKEQYAKLNDFIEANLLDEWAANAHKRVSLLFFPPPFPFLSSSNRGCAQFVDVRMHKSKIPALETLGLKYTVHIDNLQALVDEEQARLAKRVVPTKIRALPEFFDDYHTYEEIDEFWQDLAASYPDIVNYITIGETYEGRPITGVKIGARGATKGAFFNGGQHAREWISNPTVQGIAYNLASLYYANDTEVVEFVDNIEFTIVAPLNPDGFVYTWSDDRLWRKNREPNAGAICIGVDTNRNWGYKWGTGGSSNQPCSDTYMGPSAMSSYEPQAVDAYLKSRLSAGIDVLSYIDFHAYSRTWLFLIY